MTLISKMKRPGINHTEESYPHRITVPCTFPEDRHLFNTGVTASSEKWLASSGLNCIIRPQLLGRSIANTQADSARRKGFLSRKCNYASAGSGSRAQQW
jgi:hypothetical protein